MKDEEDEVLGEAIDDSDLIDFSLRFFSLQRSLSRGFLVCKELVSVDEQHHDLAAQGGGGAAGGRGGRRERGMEEDTRRKGCTGEQEWTVIEVGRGLE